MANRANGPMIRHQQWSTFNRNISYQQRRSREISQISQNNIRRNQRDQQRLTRSNYHVSYDGQIVYSEDDTNVVLDVFGAIFGLCGGTITLLGLINCYTDSRQLNALSGWGPRVERRLKDNMISSFKHINRLSLIFYIPFILLNVGRILDFTLSLRQRLVEVLRPKDGAGDGQND